MTEFLDLSAGLKVAGQITEADISKASHLGIGLIINNRPDGEETGQPLNATLESAAKACGINWQHIPMVPGNMTMDIILSVANALASSQGSALIFCRTGTRSTNLWALASAMEATDTTADIISKAASAGYDLRGLQSALEQLRPDSPSK